MVENELNTSLTCVGYRQVTEHLTLKYGANISKEEVRKALKEVDPSGVEERRRKAIIHREYLSRGLGSIYHLDGNDKLKRLGFCIHGCVDGFSRKLLWLFVASSNKDPLIIANYYLRCVKKYGLAPNLLRMDKGTENIYCEDLQVFLLEEPTVICMLRQPGINASKPISPG